MQVLTGHISHGDYTIRCSLKGVSVSLFQLGRKYSNAQKTFASLKIKVMQSKSNKRLGNNVKTRNNEMLMII